MSKPNKRLLPPVGKKSAKATLDTWPIGRLRSNPMQGEYYRPLSDGHLQQLAKRHTTEGMPPIHVLSTGVILDGEQRWRVAKLRKERTVPVMVRHDLEAEGETAILQYFLEANEPRHQLTPLQRIRLDRARLINEGRDVSGLGQTELCKLIGQRLAFNYKLVERELKVLQMDRELQDVYDTGVLTRSVVNSLHKLPKPALKPLFKLIASGKSEGEVRAVAKALLEEHKPVPKSSAGSTRTKINKLLDEAADLLTRKAELQRLAGTLERERAVNILRLGQMLLLAIDGKPRASASSPSKPLPAKPLASRPLPTKALPTKPLPTKPLPTKSLPSNAAPAATPADNPRKRPAAASGTPGTSPVPRNPLPTLPTTRKVIPLPLLKSKATA